MVLSINQRIMALNLKLEGKSFGMIAKTLNEKSKKENVKKIQIFKLIERVKKTGSIYSEYEAKKKYRLQPKKIKSDSRDKVLHIWHKNKHTSLRRSSLQTRNTYHTFRRYHKKKINQ